MGEKYRPSNGSEGDSFIAEWCVNCARYETDEDDLTAEFDYCGILGDTFIYADDDKKYPEEWTYDENGKPCCTAYIHNSEKIPVPRCTRTKDMFGDDQE